MIICSSYKTVSFIKWPLRKSQSALLKACTFCVGQFQKGKWNMWNMKDQRKPFKYFCNILWAPDLSSSSWSSGSFLKHLIPHHLVAGCLPSRNVEAAKNREAEVDADQNHLTRGFLVSLVFSRLYKFTQPEPPEQGFSEIFTQVHPQF